MTPTMMSVIGTGRALWPLAVSFDTKIVLLRMSQLRMKAYSRRLRPELMTTYAARRAAEPLDDGVQLPALQDPLAQGLAGEFHTLPPARGGLYPLHRTRAP